MNAKEFVRLGTLGGPGLDGYAFCADVYCVDCGESLYYQVARKVAPGIVGPDDPAFCDSEVCPQPIFFGESDGPQHCRTCGEYLYGAEPDVENDYDSMFPDPLEDEDFSE